MPNRVIMNKEQQLSGSAVFITFSGNCKQALSFYQACLGGELRLHAFEQPLPGYPVMPIVSGSLLAGRVTLHGSDLVPEEGRQPGNHMAIYLQCHHEEERKVLLKKLQAPGQHNGEATADQQLVSLTDRFGVRWVLGV